jgi:hypothetical protein
MSEYNCEVYDLSSIDQRHSLFTKAAEAWQGIAQITIQNYVRITNTALCPTHLSQDRRHWYASHQDPAFAETRKELHKHEMPVIYTKRIIEAWSDFFEHGKSICLSNTTVDGVICNEQIT